MSKERNTGYRLLPYKTILAASQGDIEAINAVLRHYHGYILALASRNFQSEDGAYLGRHADDDMISQLEAKLTAKILLFQAE